MRDLAATTARRAADSRRYARAIVTAVSGSQLTVKMAGAVATVKVPALLGPTYAVNDVVMVATDRSGPFVVGKLGTSTPPATDPGVPAPTSPPTSKREAVILPSSVGSYRGGWRPGDEAVQGDWNGAYGLSTGAAYYGRQLRGLNADLSRPRAATLSYVRQAGGVFAAQAPTFWTLAGSTRPSGAPSRLSSAAGTAVAVNRRAEWDLTAAMLDDLLSGTAGGLGVYVGSNSPYIVLSGSHPQAFALSVRFYPNP